MNQGFPWQADNGAHACALHVQRLFLEARPVPRLARAPALSPLPGAPDRAPGIAAGLLRCAGRDTMRYGWWRRWVAWPGRWRWR